MAVSKKAMRNPEKWGSAAHHPGFKQALLNDPCVYCGESSETMEHVVPQSAGGKAANNLVGACLTCNNERGSKPFLLWMMERGLLHGYNNPISGEGDVAHG